MKRGLSCALAGLLGLATLGSAPTFSAPLSPPPIKAIETGAPQPMQVQDRPDQQYLPRRPWRGEAGRDWRRPHWSGGRQYWREPRRPANRSGVYLGLGSPGFRSYEPDFFEPRYYPPQRRYHRVPGLASAHIRWCHARYRSYRSWDNSFVPYSGHRRQCVSPYSY